MFQTLTSALPNVIRNADPSSEESTNFRNAIKMSSFILSWICGTAETESMKTSKPVVVCICLIRSSRVQEEPKKKGKKGAAAAAEHGRMWDWEHERRRAVEAMCRLVQLDVSRLWSMSCPEEQFIKYAIAMCGAQACIV